MKRYKVFTLDNKRVYYNDLQKAKKRGIQEKQLFIYDTLKNKKIDLTINTYIIYKYNKIKNDLEYIKEYADIKTLQKDYNIRNAYQNITTSIDDITHLIDSKYIIFKDSILINEL